LASGTPIVPVSAALVSAGVGIHAPGSDGAVAGEGHLPDQAHAPFGRFGPEQTEREVARQLRQAEIGGRLLIELPGGRGNVGAACQLQTCLLQRGGD
jgi:hypothetical protein